MPKIICAACKVYIDDSRYVIYTGRRHNEIMETLHDKHLTYKYLVNGFMTSDDRFVDRVEAKKIAVAANQLIVPIEETYAALYSEDVW